MRQLFLHVSLFLLSLCTFPLHATIIHVPGDSSTIQGGINGAVDGDTVLVADGIYTDDGNRDIDFTGKAIVVMSENGPEVTIVDCEGASIGFYFRSDESPTSVLKGFTITHGSHWEWPGAILISYTSPTIINCIFLENSARYGAIYSQGDYSNHNQPRLIDCTFIANSAPTFGGGMNCTYSSPMLTNCTFSENFGPIGGGLRCLYSSPTLTNCTFSGNSATDYGGAIRFHSPYGSGPTLTNCTFSGNSTSGYGGAIYVFDGVPAQLTNCIFSENSAEKGGGMYNNSSNPTVTNCTFSENDADRGGGMYNANSRPTVTNCILWGDSIDEIYNSVGDPIVTYSDVQGGYPGEGNIDADPLFFTLGGFEYFLDAGSPCIDAGIPLISAEQPQSMQDVFQTGIPVGRIGFQTAHTRTWAPTVGQVMWGGCVEKVLIAEKIQHDHQPGPVRGTAFLSHNCLTNLKAGGIMQSSVQNPSRRIPCVCTCSSFHSFYC